MLRANKELAAYFRGLRTEREARAALKIIKAFVHDREHLEPGKRPPLPGAAAVVPPVRARKRRVRRPKLRRSAAEPSDSAISSDPTIGTDD